MMARHLIQSMRQTASRHLHNNFPACARASYLSTSVKPTTVRADPSMVDYRYWNREESEHGKFSAIKTEDIVRTAKIISLTGPNDDANSSLHNGPLPNGATLLGIGGSLEDFDVEKLKTEKPNVIFCAPSCPMARIELPRLLDAFPTVEWVHARSAGIDFITSDELANSSVYLTNAKGQFSSILAEYAMMACSYFAKDLPRLMRQKQQRNWGKYDVEELRGKTMGIVGYGDIGHACAKLACVYGMKIVALRRNPDKCKNDPHCDTVYGTGKQSLVKLMSESDYIVCSAPSTIETRGMVDVDAFRAVKKNAVFINVGRGPVVDEDAMIEALKTGKLKGAALDVFSMEPLPVMSELWGLDNVLISPHNMDQTATFMHEATEFFVRENLPRFICGEVLLNPTDKALGY